MAAAPAVRELLRQLLPLFQRRVWADQPGRVPRRLQLIFIRVACSLSTVDFRKPRNYPSASLSITLFAALLVVSPVYLKVSGVGRLWFYVAALVALAGSVGMAFSAVAQYRHNPWFDFIGVMAFFLILAVGAHLLSGVLSSPWDTVSRVAAIGLVAIVVLAIGPAITMAPNPVGAKTPGPPIELRRLIVSSVSFLASIAVIIGTFLQVAGVLRGHS